VRFELGAYALKPGIRVIAPWREWDAATRATSCSPTARQARHPVDYKKRGNASPYSMDANLLHISYEGGRARRSLDFEPEEGMWRWTVSPELAPDPARVCRAPTSNGDIVAIDGVACRPPR
jgi:argininosuccinate synthase